MKKNLGLAFVLGLLVWAAWLLEGREGADVDSPIWDKGEPLAAFEVVNLVEISLPHSKLIKDGQELIVADLGHPADTSKTLKLINKLNSLRSLKELKVSDEKKEEFFSHQDHFIRVKTFEREWELRLGDVSELTGNFYIQIFKNGKQRLYLAKDVSLFEGFYQNELEADLRKYLELKNIIAAKPFDFADKRLFARIHSKELRKVKIDNKRVRWFELDFTSNTTTPAPPEGIQTADLKRTLSNLLEKSLFLKFFEMKKNALENPLSKLKLRTESEEVSAELYGSMNGRRGLFVMKSNEPDRIYELEGEAAQLFFENVQVFWDKRLNISGIDFKSKERLRFSLGADRNRARQFEISNVKEFKVEAMDPSIQIKDQKYFNLLFNAILANRGFEQALSVAYHTKEELEQRIKRFESKVFMRVFDKDLVFSYQDGLLVLLDLKHSLELVFPSDLKINRLSEKLFFAFKQIQR
ncbi:MAG: hypothetical protein WEB87_01165 [Bacteriovoracaceae bacterium]